MKTHFSFLPILLILLPFFSLFAEEATPATATPPVSATINSYPLTTCIVSGDKLGGPMGAPVVDYYQGEEIQFCCKDCIQDFKKDPEKYLKRLHEAEAKAKAEKKE